MPRLLLYSALVAALLGTTGSRPASAGRDVTFEQRIEAEQAIERVYRTHQIGAALTRAETVSAKSAEGRVRDYLKRSLALERIWHRPITAEALRRETERIARSTRNPTQLLELYEALDNDPFLIQECLARPVLVTRLVRNFFAGDERIHARSRQEVRELRRRLAAGELAPEGAHPLRSEVEIVALERSPRPGVRDVFDGARRTTVQRTIDLTQEEYAQVRSELPRQAGRVGEIEEELGFFSVRVVLEEEPGRARIAGYTVPKQSLDSWWAGVSPELDEMRVLSVASALAPLPRVRKVDDRRREDLSDPCLAGPDNLWDNGVLENFPERSGYTTVWTGTEMIVWGGVPVSFGLPAYDTGARYDPTLDTWSPTSIGNAPSGRWRHAAVWSGTEMIVWGGEDTTTPYLSDGGRYDPTTDTWSSLAGQPDSEGRSQHTAMWTGTEMIVWGGLQRSDALSSGARYDPSGNIWTLLPTINAPEPRSKHTAVWTGTEMIIWGGDGESGELDTGAFYRPLLDRWTPLPQSDAPSPRGLHTAVWTGTEMIVWGGRNGSTSLDSGGRITPHDTHWTATTTLGVPDPRAAHVAVWTGDEMLIWGRSWTELDGGRYDPSTDSWTVMSSVNQPQFGRQAVWTGNEMIVWDSTSGGRYAPQTDSWVPAATTGPIEARINHTAVWTGNEMIVWGGAFGTTNHPGFDNGARYDPTLDAWSLTSRTGAPAPRELHTAVWTGSEMIVWGGQSLGGVGVLDTGGRYDPSSDSWTPTAPANAPEPKSAHSAVWTGSEMIVWGGSYLNTGGRYDPGTDSWLSTSTTSAPAARNRHTAVWTGTEMIVWGGRDGAVFLDTGARYDPSSDFWAAVSLAGAPSGRRGHTAVWTGNEMTVWGGWNASTGGANTGGRYDPLTDAWIPTATTGAPDGRTDHSAVWTGSEMVVWGGQYSGGPFRSGGRYDSLTDNWSPTDETGAPTSRYYHTAVWTGDSMIIWGGARTDTGALYSGGRYLVSRDADGDGFVDVCDCAPQAPETFDLPFEIQSLRWPNRQTLEWDSDAGNSGPGTVYDVLRGITNELPVGTGPGESCVEPGSIDTTAGDVVEPSSGACFYYLVRGTNSCGVGPWGVDSGSNLRSTTTCP